MELIHFWDDGERVGIFVRAITRGRYQGGAEIETIPFKERRRIEAAKIKREPYTAPEREKR
jgi:hypothetical protein